MVHKVLDAALNIVLFKLGSHTRMRICEFSECAVDVRATKSLVLVLMQHRSHRPPLAPCVSVYLCLASVVARMRTVCEGFDVPLSKSMGDKFPDNARKNSL